MKFVIEHDIPIPPKLRRQFQWKDLVKKMAVGDSIWVKSQGQKEKLRQALSRADFFSVWREEGSGYRVWRVERYFDEERR